jgi:hypothetical protein
MVDIIAVFGFLAFFVGTFTGLLFCHEALPKLIEANSKFCTLQCCAQLKTRKWQKFVHAWPWTENIPTFTCSKVQCIRAKENDLVQQVNRSNRKWQFGYCQIANPLTRNFKINRFILPFSNVETV